MARLYRSDLAWIHHTAFRAVPEGAARWLLRYLAAHRLPEGAIVDLGCGSGVFAGAALRTGRRVVGVDSSRSMVTLARRTAPAARFRVGSLHDVALPPCAIVAVVGEGLSYVAPGGALPPLTVTFRRVWHSLAPGGLFVFDLVTGPMRVLVPTEGFRTGSGWAVLAWTEATRARTRFERHITTFRQVSGRYRRSDEVHTIQVYDRPHVVEALRGAGFSVRCLRGYDRRSTLPGRTVFVARKPSGSSA